MVNISKAFKKSSINIAYIQLQNMFIEDKKKLSVVQAYEIQIHALKHEIAIDLFRFLVVSWLKNISYR